MATNPFPLLLGNLNSLGFFQFLFPFLLSLAIIYGLLRMEPLKQKIDKSAAGLISIIISFFVMNYSGTAGLSIATFFTEIFGVGLIVLTGLLVLIIFLSLVGFDLAKIFDVEKRGVHFWVFIAFIIFVGFLVFLGAGGGNFFSVPAISFLGLTGSDMFSLIFFLIILGLAMWWIGRDNGNGGGGQGGG